MNLHTSVPEHQPNSDDLAQKKKKFLAKEKRRRIWIGIFVFILAIYCVLGAAGTAYIKKLLANTPTLNTSDLVGEDSTTIYDTDGNLLSEIGAYYRQNITYDQCPESLVDAFLSIEDSRFFSHDGFDIPRFTSSVINTVLHHNTQGGSTFTMQLIKNTYFSTDDLSGGTERDATIQYKVQQIYLSLQLEKNMSKKEIFAYYVNRLNFGGQIRGVQKAAEYYFNKDAGELNLSESALLAGIVNLPNKYNPYEYLDYATERRNEVLQQMLNHGYINENEYHLASSIKVEDQLTGSSHMASSSTKYAQYLGVAIQEAAEVTGKDPTTTGMKIYTSLQPQIQQEIEDIENGAIDYPNDLMQTAIISINNKNGEIVGIGGGRNYTGGSLLLNRATQQYKQPGSSIKPAVDYPLAFEYLGYSLDEIVQDRPITFPAESRVLVNANGKYAGDLTITSALQNSLNIPAILTLEHVTAKIGSNAIVDYMHSIGFSKVSYDDFHQSYAIGGNSFTTTVEELAGAHAAMINLGVYNQPHTIRSIEFTDGSTYEPTENQDQRVLSSGSAYLMDTLMNRNTDGTVYNYMQIFKNSEYPVYAKTGTTDWGKDGMQYGIPEGAMKDKWMVASTSQYTNAVWLGYDKAIAGEHCYFTTAEDNLNIPGQTNQALIDLENSLSPETSKGVTKPDDVKDVTYLTGTYPHVADDGTIGGKTTTSSVSEEGLNNMPTVSQADYTGKTPVLSSFDASMSNGIMYINWNTQDTCSGSRNISLKDGYNNISMYGACKAASASQLSNTNAKYYADIYVNDEFYTKITSKTSFYTGIPGSLKGNIKVCGSYTTSKGTSNQSCVYAGDYDADAGINISK
ncbi:MAG: penicillin-binding protein [Erysipelotrichaceae bacterium]|nr:penicillin-binding protein [Erysipelotrichaceae bacterium]